MKNVLISMLVCLSASTAMFGQVQRESLNTKDFLQIGKGQVVKTLMIVK